MKNIIKIQEQVNLASEWAFIGEDWPIFNQSLEKWLERKRARTEAQVMDIDPDELFKQKKFLMKVLKEQLSIKERLNIGNTEIQTSGSSFGLSVKHFIYFEGEKSLLIFKPSKVQSVRSSDVKITYDDEKIKLTYLFPELKHDDYDKTIAMVKDLIKNDSQWVKECTGSINAEFDEFNSKMLPSIIGRTLHKKIKAEDSLRELESEVSQESYSQRNEYKSESYTSLKWYWFGFQKGKCAGTDYDILYSEATWDHIIPKSRYEGGDPDSWDNLQLLCDKCNGLKDDMSQEEYLSDIQADPSRCMGWDRTQATRQMN